MFDVIYIFSLGNFVELFKDKFQLLHFLGQSYIFVFTLHQNHCILLLDINKLNSDAFTQFKILVRKALHQLGLLFEENGRKEAQLFAMMKNLLTVSKSFLSFVRSALAVRQSSGNFEQS